MASVTKECDEVPCTPCNALLPKVEKESSELEFLGNGNTQKGLENHPASPRNECDELRVKNTEVENEITFEHVNCIKMENYADDIAAMALAKEDEEDCVYFKPCSENFPKIEVEDTELELFGNGSTQSDLEKPSKSPHSTCDNLIVKQEADVEKEISFEEVNCLKMEDDADETPRTYPCTEEMTPCEDHCVLPTCLDTCEAILPTSSSQNTKLIHQASYIPEKPFSCEICDLRFTKKSILTRHIKRHNGEKSFSCKFCDAAFFANYDLNEHMRTHTGENPFSCEICVAKFPQRYRLIRHISTHFGERPFSCKFCGAKFIHKSNLIEHNRTHTGEKPFLCKICHAKFAKQSNLYTHIKTHTDERPFLCTFCDARFISKYRLNEHVKTHTGEKPFVCEICQAKFAQRNVLKTHMKTHTGERPFMCTICPAKFAEKGNLNTHIRIHTGERPFSCTFCDATFIRKNHLNEHIKRHTSAQWHSLFKHISKHSVEKPLS